MLTMNPLADDAMKPRVLPLLPDLEAESETVHTWEIESWRNLCKKARGPIFECGGHPWYVESRLGTAKEALQRHGTEVLIYS